MRLLTTLAVLILAAGLCQAQDSRRFLPHDVERMKAFAVANATGANPERLDCLETLNENLRMLFDNHDLKLSSTVDRSMGALGAVGRAEQAWVFGFEDPEGRPTRGVTQPKTLRHSVWDGLLKWADGEAGYFVFGLSPLDGNHSVLLVLDANDPAQPRVFWVDQWSSKRGWDECPDRESLDGEIEDLTSSWWLGKYNGGEGVRFKSDCKLYPLIPNAKPSPNLCEITRAYRLRLRTGPGTSNAQLRDERGRGRFASRGETYQVLERRGSWVRVRLEDGGEAWAHGGYMQLSYEPPAPPAPVVVAIQPEVPEGVESTGALAALDGIGE